MNLPFMDFHGEVSSADASGSGVAFTLYPNGSLTAYTLLAADQVAIESVKIARAAAGTFGIFVITDADGKRVVVNPSAAGLSFDGRLVPPVRCPVGVVPVLIAAAGTVVATIEGRITIG
jgi:hypothetical protein